MTKKQKLIQYVENDIVEDTTLLTFEKSLISAKQSSVIWGLTVAETIAFINMYFNDDLVGYRPTDPTEQIEIYGWSMQDYRRDEMDD